MNPNEPYTQNPSQQPNVYTGGPGAPQASDNKKKLLIIGGAAVGFIVLLLVIVMVVSSGGGKQEDEQPVVVQPEGPQAATTVGIEHVNNSINQDLSELDKEKDFPSELLGDDGLGL